MELPDERDRRTEKGEYNDDNVIRSGRGSFFLLFFSFKSLSRGQTHSHTHTHAQRERVNLELVREEDEKEKKHEVVSCLRHDKSIFGQTTFTVHRAKNAKQKRSAQKQRATVK